MNDHKDIYKSLYNVTYAVELFTYQPNLNVSRQKQDTQQL